MLLLCAIVSSCGGSDDADGGLEDAQPVLEELQREGATLRKDEFLVIGSRGSKFAGPYSFGRGGYVMRFKQLEPRPGRLTISLESQRNSRKEPYQLVVATTEKSGTRNVEVSGRLFVHVVSETPPYVVRFTPKRRKR